MTLTQKKLDERKKYMKKKLGWSETYWQKIYVYLLEQSPYNPKIGYCGRGNSACKNESVSSKLVPDFKSKNISCYFHDLLYEAVKINLITKDLADKFFKYSMYFDAGWNPFKRLSAYMYYTAVLPVGVE